MEHYSTLSVIQSPSAFVVLDSKTGDRVIMQRGRRFQETLGLNPIIKLNGISKDRLKLALMLFDKRTVAGFSINKETRTLVYYENKAEGMFEFPFRADIDGMTEFAWQFLNNTPYPKKPNKPGNELETGWYCWCDEGGKINGVSDGAFVAIQPMWIIMPGEDAKEEEPEHEKGE